MDEIDDLIEEWLELSSFTEIMEEQDLEPSDVLRELWKHGLVELPQWAQERLEDELRPGEEED